MQQLYKWSGLWRPLSSKNFYHRILLISATVAALVSASLFYYCTSPQIAKAAAFGAEMGLAVFFSWALSREIHPDAPKAAIAAILFASAGLVLWPTSHLLLLFQILLLLRLLNRSSGISARPADVLLLLILIAYLLYKGEVVAGAMATGAFLLNANLPYPQKAHLFWGLLTAGLTILLLIQEVQYLYIGKLSTHTTVLIAVLASSFAFFCRKNKKVQSTEDASANSMNFRRLRAAQLLLLMALSTFSLWYGDAFFRSLIPAWASLAGASLFTSTPSTN